MVSGVDGKKTCRQVSRQRRVEMSEPEKDTGVRGLSTEIAISKAKLVRKMAR